MRTARFSISEVDLHRTQKGIDFVTFQTINLHSCTLVHLPASYAIAPNVIFTARIEHVLNPHYEEIFGYRTEGFCAFAGLSVELGG
jgi:outer membrane cobalamin receptor